jgi:hypothetical protein
LVPIAQVAEVKLSAFDGIEATVTPLKIMQGNGIGGALRLNMVFDPDVGASLGKKGAFQDLI